MVPSRRTEKSMRTLLSFVLCMVVPVLLSASGNWKKVAATKQNDLWYVEQTIGFSSKGSVLSTRARLKFVPGNKSAIGRNVQKGLLTDGIDADTFHYFVESVEVDCKKKLFTVSNIDFFDSEDQRIFGQVFAEPKQYPSPPGSAFEIMLSDLCQIRSDPLTALENSLKNKKPFLYFYP
jgi:hypothetical protein